MLYIINVGSFWIFFDKFLDSRSQITSLVSDDLSRDARFADSFLELFVDDFSI